MKIYLYIKSLKELKKAVEHKILSYFDDTLYGYGKKYIHKGKKKINKFPAIFMIDDDYITHMPINKILEDEENRKEYANKTRF